MSEDCTWQEKQNTFGLCREICTGKHLHRYQSPSMGCKRKTRMCRNCRRSAHSLQGSCNSPCGSLLHVSPRVQGSMLLAWFPPNSVTEWNQIHSNQLEEHDPVRWSSDRVWFHQQCLAWPVSNHRMSKVINSVKAGRYDIVCKTIVDCLLPRFAHQCGHCTQWDTVKNVMWR
jgi:hypothetical protein